MYGISVIKFQHAPYITSTHAWAQLGTYVHRVGEGEVLTPGRDWHRGGGVILMMATLKTHGKAFLED